MLLDFVCKRENQRLYVEQFVMRDEDREYDQPKIVYNTDARFRDLWSRDPGGKRELINRAT